jgi:hypothetical protein
MKNQVKEQDYQEIREEIVENWKKQYSFLGIKRAKIEALSSAKKWKKRKVIAMMRRKKEIYLNRWYYLIDVKNIVIFKKEVIDAIPAISAVSV